MQRQLLTQHALTYQKALNIAKGMEAVDSNTRLLKLGNCQLIRFFIEHRQEQRGKPVTAVIKQAISQINAVLRMHIVMLAVRKGIFLQCASPHPGESLLRRRYVKSLLGRS